MKVLLTDVFHDPRVVADLGTAFPGFRQARGTCGGCATGNFGTLTMALERVAGRLAKCFLPWWPYTYLRARLAEGTKTDEFGVAPDGILAALARDGLVPASDPGVTERFLVSDGLYLGNVTETRWNNMAGGLSDPLVPVGRRHLFRPLVNITAGGFDAVRDTILSGKPVLSLSQRIVYGVGAEGPPGMRAAWGGFLPTPPYGHWTTLVGFWDHPNFGPCLCPWNQWDNFDYKPFPDDVGTPRSGCWATRDQFVREFMIPGGHQMFTHAGLDWN